MGKVVMLLVGQSGQQQNLQMQGNMLLLMFMLRQVAGLGRAVPEVNKQL